MDDTMKLFGRVECIDGAGLDASGGLFAFAGARDAGFPLELLVLIISIPDRAVRYGDAK